MSLKNFLLLFLLMTPSFIVGGSIYAQKKASVVEIENKSLADIKDYAIQIPLEKLQLQLGSYALEKDGNLISPIELVKDVWGKEYALFLIDNLQAKSVSRFEIQQGEAANYPKRTAAELTHKIGGEVVDNKYVGDYSWVKTNSITFSGDAKYNASYLKYEGPGWESDKVAMRFYLDNRNAIDVFGKCTPELVLAGVGADRSKSYHKLEPWGMDNQKVGPSLGLGSIAFWDGQKATRLETKDSTNCIIQTDGKLRSQVKTIYHGLTAGNTKCNLTSLISIDAGSRSSHIELMVDRKVDADVATGIIKIDGGKLITSNDSNSEWSYIATFGKQSMNNDIQGLCIFAPTKQVKQITEDELNHLFIFQPDVKGYTQYYIMATWELDAEPIKTEEDFMKCIQEQLNKLNNNIQYKITK